MDCVPKMGGIAHTLTRWKRLGHLIKGKLRLREVESIVQHHTAEKFQRQDSNLVWSDCPNLLKFLRSSEVSQLPFHGMFNVHL